MSTPGKPGNLEQTGNPAFASEKILRNRILLLEKELKLARLKLKKTENTLGTLRNFLARVPYGINVTAGDHTIIYANEIAKKLLGDDIEGKSYPALFAGAITPDTSIIDRAVEAGKEQRGITTLPDGTTTECVSAPVSLADGRKAVINMYLDVGATELAGAAIVPPGEVIKPTSDCIVITDTKGNIIFANDNLIELTGFTRAELLSSNLAVLLPPEWKQGKVQRFISTLTEQARWEGELETVDKRSRRIAVHMSSSLIKSNDDKTLGIVCVIKDITIRKKLESSIAQEKKKLSSVISTLDAAICQIDDSFRITWANHYFESHFGELNRIRSLKIEDVVGGKGAFLDWEPARDVFATGEPSVSERTVAGKAYSTVFLPVRDITGTTREVLIISREVSAEKQLEKARGRRENELKTLFEIAAAAYRNRDVGDYIATILAKVADFFEMDFGAFYGLDEGADELYLDELWPGTKAGVKPPSSIPASTSINFKECIEKKDFCLLVDPEECQCLPESLKNLWQDKELNSFIIMPIKSSYRPLGVLLGGSSTYTPKDEDKIFLKSVVSQLSIGIDRLEILTSLERDVERIREIQLAGYRVAATRSIAEIVDCLKHSIIEVLSFPGFIADVSYLGEGCFYAKDKAGEVQHYANFTVEPHSERLLKEAVSRAESHQVPKLISFEGGCKVVAHGEIEHDYAYCAAGVFPLASSDKFHGSIKIFSDSIYSFDEETLSVLQTIVLQAAMAIENARLIGNLEESMREISKKERFLYNILENTGDGILVTDRSGRIVATNRAFHEILGYHPDEELSIQELLIPDGEIAAGTDFGNLLQYVVTAGTVRDNERRLKRKDGFYVIVDFSMTPYRGEDELPAGIIISIRDASERQALQEQLFQTEKLSALGEVISSVAHELNNPLTGVIGFSELLAARGDYDDQTMEILNKILSEAVRCKKIVSNLLWFTRKHPSQDTAINVNDIIEELLKLKEYELRVSNIEIETRLAPDIPETRGDPHLLQQVFFNIMNNAHQAMAESKSGGTLTIETYSGDGNIYIRISDTGPGIHEEIQDRIFDPFFTTKLPHKGTGLGLSLSQRIVRRHGGDITLESKPGEGALFTIRLPVVKPKEAAPRATEEPSSTDFTLDSVLVVDDEESILDLVCEILRDRCGKIDTSSDAESALDMIRASDYDCIISDMKMPGMDGRELYERLAEEKPEAAMKLLFITGDTLNTETKDFFSSTRLACIEKPFTAEELLGVIKKSLSRTTGAE